MGYGKSLWQAVTTEIKIYSLAARILKQGINSSSCKLLTGFFMVAESHLS